MYDVREETRAKIDQLTALGYRVQEMWECECECNQMINSNPQLKQLVDKLDTVTPLNPREAFLGGRTNTIKLYHKAESDEQIHYSDMISLYPCANMEYKYLIGNSDFIN